MANTPIVINPPDMDIDREWREEYEPYQKRLAEDPMDIKAAFFADPGVCSCPACHEYYWAFGWVQKCAKCGFVYPTNAWAAYSYGNQEAQRNSGFRLEERLQHPYYRYGYEHPVTEPWPASVEEFKKIDWRQEVGDWKEEYPTIGMM